MRTLIGNLEMLTTERGEWYVAQNKDGDVIVCPGNYEMGARKEGYTEFAKIMDGYCAGVALPGDSEFSVWAGPNESYEQVIKDLVSICPELAKAIADMEEEWRKHP